MGGKVLSTKAAIPANYLSKIMQTLGNAGLVDATRGTGGGYRLRKRPDRIRLIEVVDLFDRTRSRPACLLGARKVCSDNNGCAAHARWKLIKEQFVEFLTATTISQIAERG